jgi:hypothetical protein
VIKARDSLDVMLVLNVPSEGLEAELSLVQRQLEISPGGWSGTAGRGKVRRLAGDREGLKDLAQAAETYMAVSQDSSPTDLMTPANLLRLAGEDARATAVFERMYTGIHGLGEQRTSLDDAHLVEACFFLGLDEEVIATASALQGTRPRSQRPGSGLRHVIVGDLAAARRGQDLAGCGPVIDWFDAAIKRERSTPFDTGHVSLHDWLEVALVLQADLTGQPSPRLREI